MTYIPKGDTDAYRANYEQNWGHVDDISHVFGWASHEKFYWQMESACEIIDTAFPDIPVISTVEAVLKEVVKYVYNHQARLHYDKGVDEGRKIVGKVEDAVTWAKKQIDTSIADLKSRVERELFTPLQAKADRINADLSNAFAKIDTVKRQADGLSERISTTSKSLDTEIKNAQAKVDSVRALYDDVEKRVRQLEAQTKGGILDLLKVR